MKLEAPGAKEVIEGNIYQHSDISTMTNKMLIATILSSWPHMKKWKKRKLAPLEIYKVVSLICKFEYNM